MAFKNNELTAAGEILWAKAQTGIPMKYTKIAIGDGYMPPGRLPHDMTEIQHKILDVQINVLHVDDINSMAVVGGSFNNSGLEEGFYYRELALYADDPDAGEILYSYGNAGDLAAWIPPESESIMERSVKMNMHVGTAAEVTASIASEVYATVGNISDHNVDPSAHADMQKQIRDLDTILDGTQAIYLSGALLTRTINGTTDIPAGLFPSADIVTGKTLTSDSNGTLGVVSGISGDASTVTITTMSVSSIGTDEPTLLGNVATHADLPADTADAQATFGRSVDIDDYAKAIADETQDGHTVEWYITAIDTGGGITWGNPVIINTSDYQEQTTAADAGLVLTGGATAGTYGSPISIDRALTSGGTGLITSGGVYAAVNGIDITGQTIDVNDYIFPDYMRLTVYCRSDSGASKILNIPLVRAFSLEYTTQKAAASSWYGTQVIHYTGGDDYKRLISAAGGYGEWFQVSADGMVPTSAISPLPESTLLGTVTAGTPVSLTPDMARRMLAAYSDDNQTTTLDEFTTYLDGVGKSYPDHSEYKEEIRISGFSPSWMLPETKTNWWTISGYKYIEGREWQYIYNVSLDKYMRTKENDTWTDWKLVLLNGAVVNTGFSSMPPDTVKAAGSSGITMDMPVSQFNDMTGLASLQDRFATFANGYTVMPVARYAQTLSSPGWYRVAQIDAGGADVSGSGNSVDISIKTQYFQNPNMGARLLLESAYGGSRFYWLGAYGSGTVFVVTKIRHTVDETTKKQYIEVYYNCDKPNAVYVHLFDTTAIAIGPWKPITTVAATQETVPGVTVLAQAATDDKYQDIEVSLLSGFSGTVSMGYSAQDGFLKLSGDVSGVTLSQGQQCEVADFSSGGIPGSLVLSGIVLDNSIDRLIKGSCAVYVRQSTGEIVIDASTCAIAPTDHVLIKNYIN